MWLKKNPRSEKSSNKKNQYDSKQIQPILICGGAV